MQARTMGMLGTGLIVATARLHHTTVLRRIQRKATKSTAVQE